MRFYNRPHTYDCGIDLHVKTMYVCILDGAGQVLVHRNMPSTPTALLEIVGPYRDGLVVAVSLLGGRRSGSGHPQTDPGGRFGEGGIERHLPAHISPGSRSGSNRIRQIVREDPAQPGGPFGVRGRTARGEPPVGFEQRLLHEVGRIEFGPVAEVEPGQEVQIRPVQAQVGVGWGGRILFGCANALRIGAHGSVVKSIVVHVYGADR